MGCSEPEKLQCEHENLEKYKVKSQEFEPVNVSFKNQAKSDESEILDSDQSSVGVKSRNLYPFLAPLTPSTQCYLFPILICFFHVETHKVFTSIWGSHVLLHKP